MENLAQRIVALEAQLQDKNVQIQQMAEAAAGAAAGLMNQPHQNVVDAHGQQINHRAEKRYDTACKALSFAPKFDGKENWRTWEATYETWWRLNKIDDQDIVFQKRSILACMRGGAVEMTRPYSEGTDTWRNCLTMNQYLDAFRAIFLPP